MKRSQFFICTGLLFATEQLGVSTLTYGAYDCIPGQACCGTVGSCSSRDDSASLNLGYALKLSASASGRAQGGKSIQGSASSQSLDTFQIGRTGKKLIQIGVDLNLSAEASGDALTHAPGEDPLAIQTVAPNYPDHAASLQVIGNINGIGSASAEANIPNHPLGGAGGS